MTHLTPPTHRPRAADRRFPWRLLALPISLLVAVIPAGASKVRLEPRQIEIPGAPAAIVPTDLNGDGVRDLAILVAATRWDSLSVSETVEMDEIEGLMEVMTVVPALVERRELWFFLGREDGSYATGADPLSLPPSVLSLAAGPPGAPLVALTDAGLEAVRLSPDGLTFEPLVDDPPVLAGTDAFLPDLDLLHDLDGDDRLDLIMPAPKALAVHLSNDEGSFRPPEGASAAHRVPLPPGDSTTTAAALTRRYPLPRVGDLDGDGAPDLTLLDGQDRWRRLHVARNAGEGRFSSLFGPFEDPPRDGDDSSGGDRPETVYFGDLDGDGRAEWVTQEDLSDDDAGMRKEMKQAKKPPYRLRFHRSGDGFARLSEPYMELTIEGYAFGAGGNDEEGISLPGGFRDLDGDGRLDLVTLTVDFSMLQMVRILTTRSLSVGLDFHLWCQGDNGVFRKVDGLDLSGKFKLDLDDLRLGRLSQFAGDFNGDGRADFVQMGRGRNVTIHFGRQGCRYPAKPDVTLRLAEEPKNLRLVQVMDLDGDDPSDLVVIQPLKAREAGVTPPVRLDLYRARVEP
ncbi:MAG: VCBS repeat-containing protein [Acidobacteriota bacterium]